MNSLASFLPLDRRRTLAAGATLPDRVQGAALFADISGFTPLTAALAQELGPQRGAEELTRHLNRLFTALITQVHRYGGVVTNFSGDAITCWFNDPASDGVASGLQSTESRSGVADQALACALALQAEMAGLEGVKTPAGSVIPLDLKATVAWGPARRFLVGDPARYLIEVLAGFAVDRMAAAEQVAERGEVVVTARLLEELAAPANVAAWRTVGAERFALITGMEGAYLPPRQPEITPLSAEMARPWLLPPVYERLQQGPDEFLAELRPSVSLFLKFGGIDYDQDDQAGDKLDSFVRLAQAILDRYQGFLLQISMGDKGSYLYASFGAPIAHEDDPARAVAAALELRALPARLTYLQPFQIGVTLGQVLSGAYGSPARRTFGSMGNDVNTSARLMTAARPGQLLASTRVARAVATEFELLALPPIHLKGIDGPFVPWELHGSRKVVRAKILEQPANALVGREDEQALLEQALARLAQGLPAILIIEGPAGIGKSRLVQALLQAAARDGLVRLVGSGEAIEQSTPYHAWRPVIEQLLRLDDHGFNPTDGEAVLTALDPSWRHLAPLLNVVLPLNLPETPLTEQMTGEARQESTHQLLIHLLRRATGGRSIVLAIEDVHWLDSVSWTLVQRVQREVQPLLLVLASRPVGDVVSATYLEIREMPLTQTLVLDMLPRAAAEQLVCRRLGVSRLPVPVSELIYEKAEGHPFFSEELAYALRDGGFIEIVNGECRLAAGAGDLRALDFPNTIQGVITSRIDLLPAAEQLTVKVASVIGRIFAFRLLRDIYPSPPAEELLLQNLQHLEQLEITPREMPEPNLAYIFKQIVTQEVVYNLMTFAQRQQLHRHTALWYEQQGRGDTNRTYPLLAHHWRFAGDAEQAVGYYEKAGENAFRDYANQEAIDFLSQALELSGEAVPPVRCARWQRLIGEAAYRLTLMDQSQAHYHAALTLLDHPLPSSSARRALGLLWQLARQLGYRLSERLPGHRAPDHDPNAPQRTIHLEASQVYEEVSEIYYNTGDFLASFFCVMTALNLAERAGPSPELARGYANMCATLGTVSLNGLADNYRQRALSLAAGVDDLSTRARIQIPLSSHSLWVGDWDRAEGEISQALQIYTSLGDWRRWSVAAWLWPQVAQGRGDLVRARDLWAELYRVAQRSRDTRHQVRSRGGQFFNHLMLGQSEEAFACAEAAGVILQENPEMMPVEERLWFAINAILALQKGEHSRARELAHEQLAAIDRARFKFDLLDVFAAPAEVLLALYEQDAASKEDAQQGLRALKQYARTYAFARPRALRCSAHLAWLVGKPRHAQALWRKSLAQAATLHMPHERTLTGQQMQRLRAMPAAKD